jgi:DNA polymerase IIIc chi subunit
MRKVNLLMRQAVGCRNLASDAGVSMPELDRALWQYSKENYRVPHNLLKLIFEFQPTNP